MTAKQFIQKELLPMFPKTKFVMAYGSGVFKQKSYSENEKPVLDIVLGIRDANSWHKWNRIRNRKHYSFMRWMPKPEELIAYVQNLHIGAKIYYNPIVSVGDYRVKYGVIEEQALIKDLLEWNDLYIAGRLHKPCLIVKSTAKIDSAQQQNLFSAVAVSCLLLPTKFSKRDLYLKLVSLSYKGDIRFAFRSENPKKIENIVDGSFEQLEQHYENTLKVFFENGYLKWDSENEEFHSFARTTKNRNTLYRLLPSSFKQHNLPIECPPESIENILEEIVSSSSMGQSIKGLVSVGLRNSISYVFQKVRKSLRK